MTEIYLIKWLAAFSPIGVVLVLMIWGGWGGGRAGAAGWFAAMIMAVVFFGADARMLAFAQMKGVLLSLNVLYIIWMALLLYHVVNTAGAINSIAAGIKRFSSNKIIQILLFGWVFVSFLQGVAGYGVPVAIMAPLLVGMGFSPVTAVVVPAIGHSWAVTFGSMAASFQAMTTVTGLAWDYLAPASAGMLGLACYLCGLTAMHAYGGWRALTSSLPAVLILGTVMAGTQYVLAVSGMWTLGSFGAGLMGLAACVLVARLPMYNNSQPEEPEPTAMGLGWALSAYGILIVVVTCGVMIPTVKDILGQVKLSMQFPEMLTTEGWKVPAESGKQIKVFGHGGALLFYSAVISYLMYRAKGYYQPGAAKQILQKTLKASVSTSLGIVSMVCFALVMDNCGMIYTLADGISRLFGSAFPLASAWIGFLGAFMTGSNTNSNVVFGALQQQTAQLAGLSVAIILASQTAGGALGSMVAPAKILVSCSTVGLAGKESPVLKANLKYGLVITAIIALATAAAIWLGLGA